MVFDGNSVHSDCEILEPPATAVSDDADEPNLGRSTETVEQSNTVDAVSDEPVNPLVESPEKSSIEPPKGVEACGQDKGPEGAARDSEAARELQIEEAQGHPASKVESLAPPQADTPTGVCSFISFDSTKLII